MFEFRWNRYRQNPSYIIDYMYALLVHTKYVIYTTIVERAEKCVGGGVAQSALDLVKNNSYAHHLRMRLLLLEEKFSRNYTNSRLIV